jgi:hypothetical protein
MPARTIILLAGTLVAFCTNAASLFLSHPYGELVDTGPVTASIADARIACSPPRSVVRGDRIVTVRVQRLPAGAPDEVCTDMPTADLGELTAGRWTIVLDVLDSTGTTTLESSAIEVQVRVPGGSCNRDHWRGARLIALHRSLTPAEVARRVASDPAFAARLGAPQAASPLVLDDYVLLDYAPLDNVWDKRALLLASGEFEFVGENGLACFSPAPPDRMGSAVEYHHAGLDHYFYTSDPDEMRGLDEGTGARGWRRTGKSFTVLLMPGCPPARVEQAAYRFLGRPGVGPASHFFTVDREECRIVEKSASWQYEGATFFAAPVNARGECDSNTRPLHRLWKPFGESSHRFTPEPEVVAGMVLQGWVHDGPAMCIPK